MPSDGRNTGRTRGFQEDGGGNGDHGILTIRNILVVDDESAFAEAVQRHLRREGFFADVAYDGRAACRKVEEGVRKGRPFDLVVTDVCVPGMDGVAFLQWVKKTHPGVSTITVSAYGANRGMVEALRPDLDIAGGKPASPEAMMGLIRRIDVMRQACLTLGEPAAAETCGLSEGLS